MRSLDPGSCDPENPWRNAGSVSYSDQPGPIPPNSVYDPEAKGLDGDTFDALLKARMTEGMAIGHGRGYGQAAAAYAEIHDAGYAAGLRVGSERRQRTLEEDLRPLVDVEGFLEKLKAKTPPRQVHLHARIDTMLDYIGRVRGRVLGRQPQS